MMHSHFRKLDINCGFIKSIIKTWIYRNRLGNC